MISTFYGLEVAKRGMSTQQAALYVTGHNISNANTPGYTRQRVNFATTNPFPTPSINRPQIPGQMGTGVRAADIQRLRDSFVDMQFQTESSKLGYWQAKSEMLTQMENIMNEPSDTGLSRTLDEFWSAFQDLAVQPQNDGARRVARERGISLANTFNYTYDSLKAIQKDYRKEIDVTQNRVNSLLRQINQVNKQVQSIEPHGYLPNDLYDERDRLVDELSSLVNIRIDRQPSGGLASSNAEGLFDIYLATPQGDILKDKDGFGIKLIDGKSNTAIGIHIQYENRVQEDSSVKTIKFFELNKNDSGFVGVSSDIDADSNATPRYEFTQFTDFNSNGRLRGFIEGYGYKYDPTPDDTTNGDDVVKGTYNDMLADLDQLVYTFASHFNEVHRAGWSLNEIRNGKTNGLDFFDLAGANDSNFKGIAGKIKLSKDIIDDVQNIAAAAEGNVLAGAFTRSNVDPNTVGNPFFTGLFDSSTFNLDAGITGDDVTQMKIRVEYNDTTKKWSYQFDALDQSGASIGNIGSDFTPPATVYGVKIDCSNVTKKFDSDTWTATFSPKGAQAKDQAFIGNGSNALKLANVKDDILSYGGTLTNVQVFYQGMIGKLGDSASEAEKMTTTAEILKGSVEERRMSISNVSLDEEMTNLIKFQHAYNAAARNITLIDEMLDKIINGMGVVGR